MAGGIDHDRLVGADQRALFLVLGIGVVSATEPRLYEAVLCGIKGRAWLIVPSGPGDSSAGTVTTLLAPITYNLRSEKRVSATLYQDLFLGDVIQTGDQSEAELLWVDGAVTKIGPNTRLTITAAHRVRRTILQKIGDTLNFLKYLAPQATKVIFNTPQGATGLEGTEFKMAIRQKIAYVNGADLWLMNEDGTGKRLYLTAPLGHRIGRSAFSPDGSKVVYEVWDCGEDPYPETSDLWIANGDGSSPQQLLSAGHLTDATGREPFVFKRHLL